VLRLVGRCLIDAQVGVAEGSDLKVMRSVDDLSCGLT
jgi:hypothetical protein